MNFIIENDEFFKHFLSTEPKNSNVIENILVSEQIKKLSDGINVLNTELQNQINLKHKDLLSQASCSSTLETQLADIQNHVQSLHSGAEKIKRSITEPYKILESDIHILQRLHSACHILRYVALMQQWLRELDKTSDQIAQAKIINNLTELVQDPLLSDVEIISANIRQIHLKRQQLSKLAKSQLKQAVITENKTLMITFIQILANLQILNNEIEELVKSMIHDISMNIKTILTQSEDKPDSTLAKNRARTAPGGANLTNIVTISREKLWSALEGLFADKMYQQCKQIKLLESLLLELTNSANYEKFSLNFWNKAIETAVNEMKNSSPVFQSIFEEDYPCILKLYSELTRKLNTKEFVPKQTMMVAWENVYLSKSLSKLLDKLTEMFSESNTYPSQDNIDGLTRIISNELSVALIEETLSNAIAKNVAKSVKSFTLKCENIISTTSETSHTIGVTNASQQFNVQLANSMLYFKTQLIRMLTNMSNTLSKNTVQIIEQSLKNIDQAITTIISPLVDSINSAIETIILTIHAESDWNRLQMPTKKLTLNCSPYMRELIEYIARAYNVHLSPFNPSEALSSSCAKIAIRCIDLFVRHSSLVRPISEGGRLRLQADYRDIEQALCVIYPQLQTLGTPYRLLKSMGTLITLPPSEVVQSQLVGSSVPHSTVLLMLFSHASVDLQSPYQTTNWSIEKLSKWFDEHTDEKNRSGLKKNGMIVIKENVTSSDQVEIDNEDSSVTRPLSLLEKIFEESNLRVIKDVKQTNFPKGLYGVHMIALKPKINKFEEKLNEKLNQLTIND